MAPSYEEGLPPSSSQTTSNSLRVIILAMILVILLFVGGYIYSAAQPTMVANRMAYWNLSLFKLRS